MTGRAIRRYQMLMRVSRFGMDHAASFPSDTVAAGAFADIQAAAHALGQHALAQASARGRDKVQMKNAARSRLRETLRAIGRTARALALDAPGLASRFRVPKTNGDHALLTAGRAALHGAGELAADFIGYGLAATFLADLDDAIKALEGASGDCAAARQTGVAATAGVDAELARGLSAIRRLDVIVANVCRDNRPSLAAWQQARSVGQKARSTAPESAEVVTPIRLLTDAA